MRTRVLVEDHANGDAAGERGLQGIGDRRRRALAGLEVVDRDVQAPARLLDEGNHDGGDVFGGAFAVREEGRLQLAHRATLPVSPGYGVAC